MKVITEGSARVICDQCGSTLEYQWNDIKEYQEEQFVIFCPICGNAIEVPEKITNAVSNYQTVTVSSPSLTIRGNDYWTPYDMFVRDSLTACNCTAASAVDALESTAQTDTYSLTADAATSKIAALSTAMK